MSIVTKTEKYDNKTGEILSSSTKRGFEWINEDGYLFVNKACCHLLGRAVVPMELGNEAIVAFYYFVNMHLGFDNVLLVKDGRNVRFATLDDLADTLNCRKRQIYRKIKPLMNSNILIKSKNADGAEYFVVNPVYALFGHRISFRTYMDFKDYIAEYLTDRTKMSMDALIEHDEKTRQRLLSR